jgi:hypothetical protein
MGTPLRPLIRDERIVYGAIACGTVRDDASGEPVPRRLGVSVAITSPPPAVASSQRLRTLTGDRGRWCLAGAETARRVPAATDEHFRVRVSATGFVDGELDLDVPAGATLPVEAPAVTLRREPVRLQGRIVDAETGAPVGGASVAFEGSAPRPYLLALRRPLAFGHPIGTPVAPRAATQAGAQRTLVADAMAGDRLLRLDAALALPAGSPVGVGPEPDRQIAIVIGASGTTVELEAPLTRSARAGTSVRQLTIAAPPGASSRSLARPADPGDGTLVLDGPFPPRVAALADATPGRRELVDVGGLSDADGHYRVDGLTAWSRARVAVTHPSYLDAGATLELRPGQRLVVHDFRMQEPP